MRIEVLGPLRISGRKEIEVARASHRRLLAILALDAGRRIATDTLIDRLWTDRVPATARATLQMHVTALRRILPADVVVTESGGYRLDLGRHRLDLDELVACVEEARLAADARDWETLLEAVGEGHRLWRGSPYPELADDDFAHAEIARLEELHFSLVELKVEALLELDRSAEALPDLERLVAAHPLRERLWEQLMRACYRLGRHAEALDVYRRAWAAFSEVGLEPSAALRRLEQGILLHDESLAANVQTNLPLEHTAFVGRERELQDVLGLLDEHRLVTLTGVGGGGKTRLALRAATRALASFPDGCWIAELAPVRDQTLVALELADAIGVRARGEALPALTSALAGKKALIVLDNCEHVVVGAAGLARSLLESGPGLKVMATSREPLRVPGEALYEVPPMPFPEDGGDDVGAFDAVRLFEERAAHAGSSSTLDTRRRAVAHICRRLDGIPLAIELAAARVGSMTPEQIADHLDDRFRILIRGSSGGPERHRTLEATFEWSYDLLDRRARRLFARLSVFRGSFALDAAEVVCAGDEVSPSDVMPLLTALVESSLVAGVETDTTTRYRLLETLRAYAHARLEEADEMPEVRRRHTEWCAWFAAHVATGVHGAGRWELFERLHAESANLETALETPEALADGHAGTLAHALAWNALDLGHLDRSVAYLRFSLDREVDAETEAARRSLLGTALFLSGEGDEAFAESSRAADLALSLAPAPANVPVLTTCARLHLLLLDRDPATAIPLSRSALAIAEATADPFAMIYALRSLGRALVWTGEADEGLGCYRAGLNLALETGDRAMTLETYESYFVLLYLHPVARRDEPRRVAGEMLERFPPDEQRWGRYTPADWLPRVYLQTGEWDLAEEAIDRMRDRHLEGWDRRSYLAYRSALDWMRGRLDEACLGLSEFEALAADPSWHYEYYPLLATVAADQRRLADVRAAAHAYVSFHAHPSEEAKKLAVLAPLARAEADAARVAPRRDRSHHVRRAREAVERGRRILEIHPPLVRGSLQMETPWTYLALAEAELERATRLEPGSWRHVVELADTAYVRLYARFRLVEALYERGDRRLAEAELRTAHSVASELGAARLRVELESLASRQGIRVPRAS